MTKKCFKCKEQKAISNFYRHPAMGDGYLGKCKKCAKKDVQERFDRLCKNPKWLMKERDRCRKKQARYRSLGLASPSKPGSQKRWQLKYPERRKAHILAAYAEKRGRLVPPTVCEDCSQPSKLHKHHDDYSKPLSVKWLCPKCHGIAHRKPLGAPISI